VLSRQLSLLFATSSDFCKPLQMNQGALNVPQHCKAHIRQGVQINLLFVLKYYVFLSKFISFSNTIYSEMMMEKHIVMAFYFPWKRQERNTNRICVKYGMHVILGKNPAFDFCNIAIILST